MERNALILLLFFITLASFLLILYTLFKTEAGQRRTEKALHAEKEEFLFGLRQHEELLETLEEENVRLLHEIQEVRTTQAEMRKDSALLRDQLRTDLEGQTRTSNEIISNAFKNYGDLVSGNQGEQAKAQQESLGEMNKALFAFMRQSEQKLESIRESVAGRIAELSENMGKRIAEMNENTGKQIAALNAENSRQLDRMRETVDEKLQKTLNDRITQSFHLVSERLEQVYRGLGEMQNLAAGVGDLKKVLSNVKTRGILGEVQLGSILEQILSPEQYEANVYIKPHSREVVEFAVHMPGQGKGESVLLPIDAKFPGVLYARLQDAYEEGDPALVKTAASELAKRIESEAKDIHDKYIYPPFTTDFAILFLPFEGLYAEVINRGLSELIQRKYKVSIAGPTTMAALLNSLQMGFRTLAIEKHSSEVWKTLRGVKTEFGKFETVLQKASKQIHTAGSSLDTLIGTRTRKIRDQLKKVESLELEEGGKADALEGNGTETYAFIPESTVNETSAVDEVPVHTGLSDADDAYDGLAADVDHTDAAGVFDVNDGSDEEK